MKKLKEPRLKKNLYIFGCSGIGKSICDTLGRLKTHYEAIIFVDPNYEKFDGEFYGYNVIPQNNLTKNNTVGSDVIFAFLQLNSSTIPCLELFDGVIILLIYGATFFCIFRNEYHLCLEILYLIFPDDDSSYL